MFGVQFCLCDGKTIVLCVILSRFGSYYLIEMYAPEILIRILEQCYRQLISQYPEPQRKKIDKKMLTSIKFFNFWSQSQRLKIYFTDQWRLQCSVKSWKLLKWNPLCAYVCSLMSISTITQPLSYLDLFVTLNKSNYEKFVYTTNQ